MDHIEIQEAVPTGDRLALIKRLWQLGTMSPLLLTTEELNLEDLEAYFHYYTTECKDALSQGGEHTTVRKHEDIIAIARSLDDGLTRREIQMPLLQLDTQDRSDEAKEQMAAGSLKLVVRLMSMIDIGPISSTRIKSRAHLEWQDENLNFKALLTKHLIESCVDPENVKFGSDFNAYNIQRFAGLKIQWTDNINDHLRLIEEETILCIFHHVTFLKWQNRSIFPEGFAKETLRTLALLFPRYDKRTQKWINSEKSSIKGTRCLDTNLLNCGKMRPESRRMEEFKFWRDRLIILKEKFDEPRRTSIGQFWHDRRNKVQWYTFWIAVLVLGLTIFFGVAQSIEGALQVYKAYHPTLN